MLISVIDPLLDNHMVLL